MPIHLRRTIATALALSALVVPLAPAATAAVAPPAPDLVAQAGLLATNQFRAGLGLPPMTLAAALAASARSHSEYMAKNDLTGHYEKPGDPTSTGNGPEQRMAYFGYASYAGEVVDYTPGTAGNSVQDWVDTIYHRLPFVDPTIAEAGLGYGFNPAVSNGFAVTTEDFGKKNWQATWPKAVVYPKDGATGVAAAWDARENPNPLRLFPDAPASGGPTGTVISASFFDGAVDGVTIATASLIGADGSLPSFWTLTPMNDDHLRETVALIPKAPLKPATQYKVHLTGSYKKGLALTTSPYDLTWSFTTAQAGRVDDTDLTYARPGTWNLTVTGSQLGSASRLVVGGVPVTFAVQGDGSLKATVGPGWSLTTDADVEVEWPDGSVATWDRYWVANDGDLITPTAGQTLSVGGAGLRTVGAPNGLAWLEAGTTLPGSQVQNVGNLHVLKVGSHLIEWAEGSRIAYVDGVRRLLPIQPVQVAGVTYLPQAWWSDLLGTWGLQVARPATPPPVLTDISGHWAEAQIRRLVAAGIISGFDDGTFRPGATLTWAAFVKMLVAARQLPVSPGGKASGFVGVAGHWVEQQGYLSAAVNAKLLLLSDFPGSRFEPETPIARGQIAVLVVRALGLEDAARANGITITNGQATVAGKTFADAWLWLRPGYVAQAVEAGIITGYAQDNGSYTFLPLNSATRAEAAVMVARMLDHK